ncbi:MAG: amidohydrolase family protein [Rhodothalassiaceae bacterium]
MTTDWDLVICDALVFDGSGEAPVRHDIAVVDGCIATRGPNLDRSRAERVVQASGLWLMPGLLDIHTHFDLEVELEPGLPEAVRHGSTTVVVSNCSIGLAYGNQRTEEQDPIVDCFARVENIPKHVLRKVADKAVWRDSAHYLTHLDQLPLGPNIAPMIPHSMLRIEVMGLKASVDRDPTPGELARMAALLELGMQQGYIGFSTDALPFHYLANHPNQRRPIPGQFGRFKELKRLTAVVRAYDRLWQATPPKDSPLKVLRTFALTSGRIYGKPLRTTAVAALDVSTNRSLVTIAKALSRLLNSTLLDGRFRLQALAAPFKTWAAGPITPLAEEIPPLRRLNEPDLEDRAARQAIMDDPAWQADFLAMWRKGKRRFGLAWLKRRLRREDFAIARDLDGMRVERSPVPIWQGHTLGQIYRRLMAYQTYGGATQNDDELAAFEQAPNPIGDDAHFMLHLLRHYDLDLVWSTVSANDRPEVVKGLLRDPLMLPGFNDSGAHLTNMAFYDGNLRALQIAWADGLEAVATMVRRLTREPAEFFGLEAGRVEPGAPADLVLIDPARLAAHDPEATTVWRYRQSMQAEQLVNRPDGVVRGVWVSGVQLYDGQELTDALGACKAGRVLTASGATPQRLQAAA